MRRLVLFPLVVAFLILAVFGSSHIATAGAQATLDGTVTVNGQPAPAGVGLVAVLEDGTECGQALIGEDAAFTMSLAEECPAGQTVFFQLAATGDEATTRLVIATGTQTVEVAFAGLSADSLRAIGAAGAAAEQEAEQVVEKALEKAAAEGLPGVSLIRGDTLFWLVLAISVGGMVLLAVMVISKVLETRRGQTSSDQDRRAGELTYRRQIEGMVLIMVIVAIILLGISEKIGDQGLISVLAAIVGYAAGRATATE